MRKTVPFEVIYEDSKIIAVNKASGIAVCADRWDDSRERLDKLLAASLGMEKVFIVHRIDRDTSGLVVFAKDEDTHRKLSMAFEGRQTEKRYIAVTRGRPSWNETVCDLPLVPDGNKWHHTIIDKYQGKKSLTRFRLLCIAGNYSVVEAVPETGRTHQIRVHLASLGHSVVCDELYGNTKPVFLSAIKPGWRGNPSEERPLLSRLGLHAAELLIPYERGPEYTGTAVMDKSGLLLKAPLPRDMAALINQMEKCSGSSMELPAAATE
ncbi:MAG: RNA pseudouridine synthase [Treponema sp.]|nr:RNA pseudouridine synthase [Treponema sp.]